MRKFIAPLLIAYSSTQAYADTTPFMGRCHMDSCGWIKITEQKLLKQQGDARLFEVKSEYGETSHKNGNYPDKFSKKLRVNWDSNAVNYILCYNKAPVFYDGQQADVFDFANISGAEESAANEYVKVCYGAEPYAWDKKAFIKKHGLATPSVGELQVKDPMDLWKYVK